MNIKICPDGTELNPKTNRCNKLCLHGFLRNENFQCRKCIKQPLPLGQRDTYLSQIETEIRNKKKLLIKKKKDLDKTHNLNDYLSGVNDDYSKYYDYILNEKQQQQDALILLKEYIDDLIKTEYLVDEQLRTAKHEQKDIINEIDKVKAELDELIS